MIVSVKVIDNAKKEMVKEEAGVLKAYVKVPAVEGKANKALIELLSKHFKVSKKSISIQRGSKSRQKTISIIY